MNVIDQLLATGRRMDAALDVVDDPRQDVTDVVAGTLAVLVIVGAIFLGLCT